MKKTQTKLSKTHGPTAASVSKVHYSELLSRAGLSEKEAVIFMILLEKGELGAGEIIRLANLKRGDGYNQIYSLIKKGLVEETATNGWKRFKLEHPGKLDEYVENRTKELTQVKKELSGAMSAILSTYNLSYHKPGVKVFEGEEGARRMMNDTLTAKTEIIQIIDPLTLEKFLHAENERYLKQRKMLNIKKRVIFPDSPFTRKYCQRYQGGSLEGLTEIRIAKLKPSDFATSIQIYDNKYALHTLKPGIAMGIIIEDATICEIQRSIFEFIWNSAEETGIKS